MHKQFIVTLDADRIKTSQEARDAVIERLHTEHFCCGEGRWANGPADWFVVGGRYSGVLSRHSWAREVIAEIAAFEAKNSFKLWGDGYPEPQREAMRKLAAHRLDKMWDAAAPKAYKGIPYERDVHKVDGYADDAMLLTQELYDELLKTYEGSEDSDAHADLAGEPIAPDMIGRKWVVVVDYHC